MTTDIVEPHYKEVEYITKPAIRNLRQELALVMQTTHAQR